MDMGLWIKVGRQHVMRAEQRRSTDRYIRPKTLFELGFEAFAAPSLTYLIHYTSRSFGYESPHHDPLYLLSATLTIERTSLRSCVNITTISKFQ